MECQGIGEQGQRKYFLFMADLNLKIDKPAFDIAELLTNATFLGKEIIMARLPMVKPNPP
jgi:hypothetical protein